MYTGDPHHGHSFRARSIVRLNEFTKTAKCSFISDPRDCIFLDFSILADGSTLIVALNFHRVRRDLPSTTEPQEVAFP